MVVDYSCKESLLGYAVIIKVQILVDCQTTEAPNATRSVQFLLRIVRIFFLFAWDFEFDFACDHD